MYRRFELALVAALPLAAAVGCKDFLTGNKLSDNPNRPSTANAYELFVGSEVNITAQWETYPFNLFPLWVQQIAGVQRQWKNYAEFRSGTDQFTADPAWNAIYGQGGYGDLRKTDSLATAVNNVVLRGEERVLRALVAGTAADIWGDVPFTEAGAEAKPHFDTQAAVYAHVEALLDSAIADLASGQGAGTASGCSVQCDFFFNDDTTKWIAAAHTLKARYYMHQSRGTDSLALFGLAATEAQAGISSPGGDMQTSHTTTFGEQNLFYQFLIGPRAGDVEPSQVHMDVLDTTGNQALLSVLYKPNASGKFKGSVAGQSGGTDVSAFAVGPTTPMGIVTSTENQMILAEAQFRSGNATQALATLNAYRTSVGAPAEPGSPSGARILIAILEEKFARGFLNPEVYFDYLRTCVPNVPMPANHSESFNYIPARLPYGYTETISNPNLPPSQPLANANDPKNLTDPTGAPCAGQKDRPGT